MKDWEIAKVNHLYKQVDDLQDENDRLRQGSCAADKIDRLVEMVESLSKQLAENTCECKCECGSTSTTKKTVKRGK